MFDRIKLHFISKRRLQERIKKLEEQVLPPEDMDYLSSMFVSLYSYYGGTKSKPHPRTVYGDTKATSLTLEEMRRMLVALFAHLNVRLVYTEGKAAYTLEPIPKPKKAKK